MLESIIMLGLMAILLIGSPGPAAMALAATGASHRIRQGLPLVLGLTVGVLLTGLLTSIGMLVLFSQWPELRWGMQVLGGLFILYMAVQMLRLPLGKECSVSKVHFGFRSGILMNILSPKAYAVFMLLISKFLPTMSSKLASVLVLETVALIATVIVTFGWLLLGGVLGRFIRTPVGQKRMQSVFAVMMVLFVTPILFASMPG